MIKRIQCECNLLNYRAINQDKKKPTKIIMMELLLFLLYRKKIEMLYVFIKDEAENK